MKEAYFRLSQIAVFNAGPTSGSPLQVIAAGEVYIIFALNILSIMLSLGLDHG